HAHLGDPVLGITETARWQELFLRVAQRYALSHRLTDLLHHLLIADGEVELLRDRARHRDHRHLAFPRLAQPALAAELLDPAGALPRRIDPAGDDEAVQHGQADM